MTYVLHTANSEEGIITLWTLKLYLGFKTRVMLDLDLEDWVGMKIMSSYKLWVLQIMSGDMWQRSPII